LASPAPLAPTLEAILTKIPDRAFAGRLRKVYASCANAIDRLSSVDLVKYETSVAEGSPDLSLWEEMAPVIRDTVMDVNAVLAVIRESFPSHTPGGLADTLSQGVRLERGIDTGVIEPWCAVNFGDSALAPKRPYLLPDADADAARAATATKTAAFYADLKAAREGGIPVTPELVAHLAKQHGVEPPPLPPAQSAAPSTTGPQSPALRSVAR
jgi:hypothetical protein